MLSRQQCVSPALIVLLSCIGSACTHAPTQNVVLSMQDLKCADCGMMTVQSLKNTDGVRTARFDVQKAEVVVRYDERVVTPTALLQRIKTQLGFTALLESGKGSYQKSQPFSPELDVVDINRPGEWVDLKAHVVPGKVTVFDFHADWCLPCKQIDEAMAVLLAGEPRLAYRRLDIGSWDSEVVSRYMAKTPELPLVVLFDHRGEEIQRIVGLDLPRLRSAIGEALQNIP